MTPSKCSRAASAARSRASRRTISWATVARIRDAIAHLRIRFPQLVAEPFAASMPASAWGLVNDGLARRIGKWPLTTLEQGIDRMIDSHATQSTTPQ